MFHVIQFLKGSVFSCFFFSASYSNAQKLATFEIDVTKPMNGIHVPAAVNLDEVSFVPDSLLVLVEVTGAKKNASPLSNYTRQKPDVALAHPAWRWIKETCF